MPIALVFQNLRAHWLRSLLTMASVTVAVFLLVVLRALVTSLDLGVTESQDKGRIVTQSSVSLFVGLPESYQSKIASVAGVAECINFQWFGGYYQDPSNFFGQFATDPDALLRAYPEIQLIEGDRAAFVRERNSCIVGKDLASEFGWKVGDQIPLVGALFPRTDGSVWDFTVAGIYEAKLPVDNRTMYFHWDYLNESLKANAASGPEGSGVYILTTEPGVDQIVVMASVDEIFANGPQRTRTTSEAEFNRQFVGMIGNVPTLMLSIGLAVLFAIALAVLNTMLMAARERTRDLGIMKALGFNNGTAFALLLFESLLLCSTGGALGVLLAVLTEASLATALLKNFFFYALSAEQIVSGLLLSVALGLAAGVLPAWRARSLRPIDALRAEG